MLRPSQTPNISEQRQRNTFMDQNLHLFLGKAVNMKLLSVLLSSLWCFLDHGETFRPATVSLPGDDRSESDAVCFVSAPFALYSTEMCFSCVCCCQCVVCAIVRHVTNCPLVNDKNEQQRDDCNLKTVWQSIQSL